MHKYLKLVQTTPEHVLWCLHLLLCTVDELVLIGPLKARLHSFIIPQLLCVIKELLRKRETNVKNHITHNGLQKALTNLEYNVMTGRSEALKCNYVRKDSWNYNRIFPRTLKLFPLNGQYLCHLLHTYCKQHISMQCSGMTFYTGCTCEPNFFI